MDIDLLEQKNVNPSNVENSLVYGFTINFQPTANLIPSENSIVYGINALLTFNDIDILYSDQISGLTYKPIPILVHSKNNQIRASLCYITNQTEHVRPTENYLSIILRAASKNNFPKMYIEQIKKASTF